MGLDYNLEHSVQFTDETEYKNLYSWCLQEFDQEGNKVGNAQIPWNWDLLFAITNLNYTYSLERDDLLDREYLETGQPDSSPENIEEQTKPAEVRESISGTLQPLENENRLWVRYSFFGTSRTVKDFSLTIEPLEPEGIDIWGSAEYTTEIDFSYETIPDSIHVTIFVSPDKFGRMAECVKTGVINKGALRLGGVHGFYSPWSPSITTNEIKVLPSFSWREIVKFPEGKERGLPSLGKASRYCLELQRRNQLQFTSNEEDECWTDDDDDFDIANERVLPNPDNLSYQTIQFDELRKLIQRVQSSLWIIAFLLLIIAYILS